MKYAWIRQHTPEFPVSLMCQVLTVRRSGGYAWRDRPASARQLRQETLTTQIRQVYSAGRGVCGVPRVHRELLAQEVQVCPSTVAKLMAQEGLRAKTCRKFVVQTPDSDHEHPVAENLLDQRFHAALPNTVWCTDITCIPTDEGWLCLAAVLDLCSRKIVGWAMADHLRAELGTPALTMALQRRRPGVGLRHHSDRGACRTPAANTRRSWGITGGPVR